MRRATPLKKIFIEVWKIMIMFLSKWVMCRFHVNLPGCVGFMFVVFFWCLILMCAIIFCCCCYFLRDVVCGAFIFLRFAVSKPHESGPASPAFSFFALRNVSKSTPKQLGATRKFEGFCTVTLASKGNQPNCVHVGRKSGVESNVTTYSSCVFFCEWDFRKRRQHKNKHNVHERLIQCFMRPRISPGSSDVLGFPTTRWEPCPVGNFGCLMVKHDQWPYGGFLKWWYPQNTAKWSFLAGKPIVVGYHHFRKHPYNHFWGGGL